MEQEKVDFTAVRKSEVVILLVILPLLTALLLIFVVLPAMVNDKTDTAGKEPESVSQEAGKQVLKPQNQIIMNLIMQKKPEKTGDTGELLLIVTPRIDAPEMNIVLEIPQKLLPSGELEWAGDLKKGETKTLAAGFTLPDDKDYDINASAWIKGVKSAKVANGKKLSVGSGKSKTVAPKGEEKSNDKGQKIIEFEVPGK